VVLKSVLHVKSEWPGSDESHHSWLTF